MNEYLKTSRDGAAAKAKKLTSADPHQKVDSSTWTPPEELNAGVKTGARPLTKRRFKSGGTVCGDMSAKRADRKARKSGGRTESEKRATRYLTPDNLINRDVVMANEARDGKKHVGGFKKGGRTKKADGGMTMDEMIARNPMPKKKPDFVAPNPVPLPPRRKPDAKYVPTADDLELRKAQHGYKKGGKASKMDWEHSKEDLKQDKKLAKKHGMSMKKWEGSKLDEKHDKQQSAEGLKKGGRTARKSGGRTGKGKTHINVTVNTQPQGGAPAMPPMGGPLMPPPRPPMPPMGAPPMPPPGAGAPPMPPMGGPTGQPGMPGNPLAALAAMGRNSGGRVAKFGGGATVVGNQGGPMGSAIPGYREGVHLPVGGGMMYPGGSMNFDESMGQFHAGLPGRGVIGDGERRPMPMYRKSGGRTNRPEHVIDHAAGGGLGRLEKIKAYGEKPNK